MLWLEQTFELFELQNYHTRVQMCCSKSKVYERGGVSLRVTGESHVWPTLIC